MSITHSTWFLNHCLHHNYSDQICRLWQKHKALWCLALIELSVYGLLCVLHHQQLNSKLIIWLTYSDSFVDLLSFWLVSIHLQSGLLTFNPKVKLSFAGGEAWLVGRFSSWEKRCTCRASDKRKIFMWLLQHYVACWICEPSKWLAPE